MLLLCFLGLNFFREFVCMGQTPPTAPNRRDHYTVVCGGTWLNRETFANAVATHRSQSNVFGQVQDALMVKQFRQQEALQQALTPDNVLSSWVKAFTPPVLALQQGLLAVLNRLNPFAFRTAEVPLPVTVGTEAFNPFASGFTEKKAVREGLLATLFTMVLNGRKENRGEKNISDAEQKERNAFDFEKDSPDLFGLIRLMASEEAGSGGST
jgi:hypothetical protein